MKHQFITIVSYRFNRIFANLLLLGAILAVSGCGSVSVMMTVTRPAEVNLKSYNRVAIGGIEGEGAQDLTDMLTSALFSTGRFEVLDRAHVQAIQREHQLNMSGIVDEQTAVELGKYVGASVLLFGRVQETRFKQDSILAPKLQVEGKDYQLHTLRGTQFVRVNLQLVDMETGRILAIQNLQGKSSDTRFAVNEWPQSVDPTPLIVNCHSQMVSEFMRGIAPYKINLRAIFLKDDALTELEFAIANLKIGEWDQALGAFREMTLSRNIVELEVRGKANYNFGLALMFHGDYEESLEQLRFALKTDPGKSLYQDAIRQCKFEKEKADKLKDQL